MTEEKPELEGSHLMLNNSLEDGFADPRQEGGEPNKGAASAVWSREGIQRLITLHAMNEHLFQNPHYKKRSVWDLLSRQLQKDGYCYDGLQVENKWKALTKKYRDTVDHNHASPDAPPRTCPFFEELSRSYRYNPAAPQGLVNEKPILPKPHGAGSKRVAMIDPQANHNHKRLTSEEADRLGLVCKKKYMGVSGGEMKEKSVKKVAQAVGQVIQPPESDNKQQSESTSTDLMLFMRTLYEDYKRHEKVKMEKFEMMHKQNIAVLREVVDALNELKKPA